MRGSGANTYWCIECNLAFSLRFGVTKKKTRGKRFCPSCGDTEDVVKYDERPVKPVVPYTMWSVKEEMSLKELAERGFTTSQIAKELKRTVPSVYHRLKLFGLLKKRSK